MQSKEEAEAVGFTGNTVSCFDFEKQEPGLPSVSQSLPGCMNDPLLNGCPGTHKLFTGRQRSSKAACCQMWGPEKGDCGEHLVPRGHLGAVSAPALHFLFKLWELGLDTWLNQNANSYSLGLLQILLSEFLFSKHPSLLKHKHPS